MYVCVSHEYQINIMSHDAPPPLASSRLRQGRGRRGPTAHTTTTLLVIIGRLDVHVVFAVVIRGLLFGDDAEEKAGDAVVLGVFFFLVVDYMVI